MKETLNNMQKNHLGQCVGDDVEDWQERPWPERKTMLGKYCEVVPLNSKAHAEALYEAFSEDEEGANCTYLLNEPFQDYQIFYGWLNGHCDTEDPQFYAIVDKRTSKAVGMASYLRIEPNVGVIEVGHILFSTQMQRTPLSTEAMYLMMRRVFDELGYRRYEWKCDALNERSRKAALRLGFSYEGTFRQARVYKGRNRDTAWFSVLDKEWPQIKIAFERWLSEGNFDCQGVQKDKLKTTTLT